MTDSAVAPDRAGVPTKRPCSWRRIPSRVPLVIIRAAHVIPTMRADKFAVMPGKLLATCWANLRMMLGKSGVAAVGFILWDGQAFLPGILQSKIRVKGSRTMGKHG